MRRIVHEILNVSKWIAESMSVFGSVCREGSREGGIIIPRSSNIGVPTDLIVPLDGRELSSEGKVTVHGNGTLVIGSVAARVG